MPSDIVIARSLHSFAPTRMRGPFRKSFQGSFVGSFDRRPCCLARPDMVLKYLSNRAAPQRHEMTLNHAWFSVLNDRPDTASLTV